MTATKAPPKRPAPRKLKYAGLAMYPEQRAGIDCRERYAMIEATPKSGKTLGCMDWLTRQALQGRNGWEYWWSAPINTQASIAFRRLQRMLKPRTAFTVNRTEHRITLHPMETVIAFKTCDKPDSLYGEDVHALVIDEASRVKAEAWHALRSTLTATGGPARIIGNVHGRKNWFYQLCRQAQQGDDAALHYAKLTAEDAIRAGLFPQSELEDAKKRYPEAIFRELFYAEAAEDEGNPFGVEAIRACTNGLLSEAWLDYQVTDAAVAAWGVDLAETGDFAVMIGLDAQGTVVRLRRWHGPWAMTKETILGLLTEAPCLIDSTAVGKPLVEELSGEHGNIAGYLFTSSSKQELIGRLVSVIQGRRVQYPPGIIPNELESFEYLYHEGGRVEYRAMEGAHDDTVCALALAVRALDTGAHAWLERAAERQEERDRAKAQFRPILGTGKAPVLPTVCPVCSSKLVRPRPGGWRCASCGVEGDVDD